MPLPSDLNIMQLLIPGITLLVVVYFVYVAVIDYTSLMISNRSVVAGVILYAVWSIIVGVTDPVMDLLAAILLFAMGFAFWMFRLMGAGDAKFMLVCGAFAGMAYLFHFAITLAIASIAMFIIIKLASRPMFQAIVVMSRLGTIVDTRKAPYGVALSIAAMTAFLARSSGTF